ncbi:MAG: hypothetical protein BHW48_04750 [Roseburia sp. CAG:10041_57]|nr:MAG: hypothetical protein BHW48_04750 [Roseburia sp. CAG:10041_57]
MDRKKIIIKNGLAGLIAQGVAQVLNFVLRFFLLKYIGIDILGISATLSSVLATLSLSELGFETATVFYLYKPLQDKKYEEVGKILTILKRVYSILGIIILILTGLCIPFLDKILKGVNVDKEIIMYFILLSLNISISYLFSYKRTLLYADQREYISKYIDSFVNIFSGVIKICAVCVYKNYYIYLVIQIIQSLLSNLIIQLYCKKKYSYIVTTNFDMDIFKNIFNDVKSIFAGKIAGYIYGATDNLVISMTISAVKVGYLSNYTVFVSFVKKIVKSGFSSMTSIIGNMLICSDKIEKEEQNFLNYSFIRYILAAGLVIPWGVLGDNLVGLFWGKQYIMSEKIVLLLAIDLYIDIIYSPCCEYINAGGLFHIDKYVGILGALINLIFSIFLCIYIGISGVLFGTVISQVYFFIARSYVVYHYLFQMNIKYYRDYIMKNILWVGNCIGVVLVIDYIKDFFTFNNQFVELFIIAILCELILLLSIMILFGRTKEGQYIIGRKKK